MKIIQSRKWANIELDGRKCGTIYKVKIEGYNISGNIEYKYYNMYVSHRNASHVMKKWHPGHIGMSEVILTKLKILHHVKLIIIKYEKTTGEIEYYITKVSDWLDSPITKYDGTDKQYFLYLPDLLNHKVEVIAGVLL